MNERSHRPIDLARGAVLTAGLALFTSFCAGERVRVAPPNSFEDLKPFAEAPVDYTTVWTDREETHPFTGGAVIDVDGDGREEIFVSGGRSQDDALLRYEGGRLKNVIAGTGLSRKIAAYGATAIDLNHDGRTDLLLARNTGVFLYLNRGGKFSEVEIPVKSPDHAVPLSISAGDIDRDGDIDLYVSYFVAPTHFKSVTYNDPEHAKQNRLLLNQGDLKFNDITRSAGAGGINNTFFSTFVDLNNDDYLDLILVQNTGEVELLENRKNRTFVRRGFPSGYGVWMGLAVGDIDRDGDQDLLFTNSGVTVPAFLTSGDLRDDQRQETEWLLLRNEGDFRFVDSTAAYGLSGLGFAWGALFEDLNLDGHLDLMVAQNYIKWPPHKLSKLPGKIMLQARSGSTAGFYHRADLGLENPHFGQTPLTCDFNGDGRPDVLWLNMHGPVRAFRNQSASNFVAVALPDTPEFHGAKITLRGSGGATYTREATNGSGLQSDPTPMHFFGLGRRIRTGTLTIRKLDGTVLRLANPPLNKVVRPGDFKSEADAKKSEEAKPNR